MTLDPEETAPEKRDASSPDGSADSVRFRHDLLYRAGMAVVVLAGAWFLWTISEDSVGVAFLFFRLIAVSFLLMAVVAIVEGLPDSRIKGLLGKVVRYPVYLFVGVFYIGAVVGNVFLAVIILLVLQLLFWEGITTLIPYTIHSNVLVYASFTTTLVLLAYGGPRILLPIVRLFLPVHESDSEESLFPAVQFLLYKVHFRRRAYELGFIVFTLATIERIGHTTVAANEVWKMIMDVSLEAFLTFIVIDQYVSSFIPRLITDEENTT